MFLDTHKSIDLAEKVNENTDTGRVFLVAIDREGYKNGGEHLISKGSDSHANAWGDIPSVCLFQLEPPYEQTGEDGTIAYI